MYPAKIKFEIDKKSSSKFREIEIFKNQVQIDKGNEINTIHILKAVSDVFQASGTQLFVISFFCLSKKIVKIIFEKENLLL